MIEPSSFAPAIPAYTGKQPGGTGQVFYMESPVTHARTNAAADSLTPSNKHAVETLT